MINFIKKGIDTSDANATTEDIAINKTAYVNGEKITGVVIEHRPNTESGEQYFIASKFDKTGDGSGLLISGYNFDDGLFRSGTYLGVNIGTEEQPQLAELINLTADKIKKDESVLGITGTLQPVTDYIISENMNNSNPYNFGKQIKKIDTVDMANCTNAFGAFQDYSSLERIDNINNTSNITSIGSLFDGCKSLTYVPAFDTSKVNVMSRVFYDCNSIVDIPQLDTSKVTTMINAFTNCNSLSNNSLNTILAMLTNATFYSQTKTLANIGLSQEQATICITLQNWTACEAAGWTTGY